MVLCWSWDVFVLLSIRGFGLSLSHTTYIMYIVIQYYGFLQPPWSIPEKKSRYTTSILHNETKETFPLTQCVLCVQTSVHVYSLNIYSELWVKMFVIMTSMKSKPDTFYITFLQVLKFNYKFVSINFWYCLSGAASEGLSQIIATCTINIGVTRKRDATGRKHKGAAALFTVQPNKPVLS